MPFKEFKETLDAFDPTRGIEDSRTPPYKWYTDADFFAREVGQIFQKSWLPVGRVDQVKEPGDYFVGEIVGNPYVIARANDGSLYAHHNVCRHKGAVVAQQEDDRTHSCHFFQCPFHGWEYHLDGKLKKAPMLGPQKSFEPGRYGLQPISLTTWGPFIFVDLDGKLIGGEEQVRNLPKDLSGIAEHIEPAFQGLKFYKRYVYEMNCNWKVFVDNSLDGGYHVKYAHEGLADGLDLEKFETHVFDRSSIQICDSKGEDKRLGDKVMYAYLFPNMFINRYGSVMDVNIVEPIDVDRCRVIFDFYFDYEDFEQWESRKRIRQDIASSHIIQQEDIDICESTQKGMKSMSWRWGRYSSVLEKACYAFHVLLWKELQGFAE